MTFSRTYRYLCLWLPAVLIAGFLFSFTYGDRSVGFTSDDAVYLLLADRYSPWINPDSPVPAFVSLQSHFPPLYPLALGLLGAGSGNPAYAAAINTGFLLLAIIVAGQWARRETGSDTAFAAMVITLSVLPGTLIFAQELWSEFLFMIFTYGVFALAVPARPLRREWTAMALLAALAALSRATGIVLIAAVCTALIRHRPRQAPVYAAVCLLPLLPWYVSKTFYQENTGYQDIFFTALNNLPLIDPVDFLAGKIRVLLDSTLWLFSSVESGVLHQGYSTIIILIGLVFSFAGFLIRLRHMKVDAFFLLLYMPVMLIWPYDDVYFVSRFLYPLIPLLLFYAGTGINLTLRTAVSRRLVASFVLGSLLIVCFPSTGQFIRRGYDTNMDMELLPYRRDRGWLLAARKEEGMDQIRTNAFILKSLDRIAGDIPESECIYGIQAPLIMLHTGRITGVLPPPEANDNEFNRQTRYCSYMLSLPTSDLEGSYPDYYPLQRIRENHYHVTPYYRDRSRNKALFVFRRNTDTIRSD